MPVTENQSRVEADRAIIVPKSKIKRKKKIA